MSRAKKITNTKKEQKGLTHPSWSDATPGEIWTIKSL